MDTKRQKGRSRALRAKIIGSLIVVIACSFLAQRALARGRRALRRGRGSARRALRFNPFTLRTRGGAKPPRGVPAAAAAAATPAVRGAGGDLIEIQVTNYSFPSPRIPHRPARRSPVRPPRG